MPGEFVLTGAAVQLVGDSIDVGDEEDLLALAGMIITFTSNIPRGRAVPIPGDVMYVPPRSAVVLPSGQISEDGTNPGVRLLANDPDLELTNPLQWHVQPGRVTIGVQTFRPAGWWFDAPDPGDDKTIDELTPVPGVGQTGGTRGPRGYAVDDVDLVSGTGALTLTLTTSGDDVTASVTTTGEDTIQFSAHTVPVGDPLPMLVAGIGSRSVFIDPSMDFGAIGDAVTDDTTALQAAFTAAASGGTVAFPPGKTFKYMSTLTIPVGATIIGDGRAPNFPTLKAGHADALIKYAADPTTGACHIQMRDMQIEGNGVGRIGVYVGNTNRPSMHSVQIHQFTQAGVVLDQTQNGVFEDCTVLGCGTGATPSGWPAVSQWMLINGCNQNRFNYCVGSGDVGQVNINNRSITIANITADVGGAGGSSRFTTSVFLGVGNGENSWSGGIYEGGAAATKIDISAGAANWPTIFDRIQVVGVLGPLVKVATCEQPIVFNDVIFNTAEGSSNGVVANASSGRIIYRGQTQVSIDNFVGLRDGTVLSGTASVHFDEHTRELLGLIERRFDASLGNWVASGATAVVDATTKSMSITGFGAINNGVYNGFTGPAGAGFYGNYSQNHRLVRVRCYLSDKVGGWKLTSLTSASPFLRDTGITLAAGYNDVIYEMGAHGVDGHETGIAILQSANEAASVKVRFIDVEHLAG